MCRARRSSWSSRRGSGAATSSMRSLFGAPRFAWTARYRRIRSANALGETFRIFREEHPDAVPPCRGSVGYRASSCASKTPSGWRLPSTETARLVDTLDAKGVHGDFENLLLQRAPDPIYPSNANRFFRELRRRLPGAFISAVIPSTAPGVRSWKQPHSVTEVDEIVKLVDQLVVLYYDTSIQDPRTFEEGLAIQIDHFARWKALASQTQLLVALGTFVNGPQLRRFRDVEVESIQHHFMALTRATAQHPPHLVHGSEVYCEWQTDASGWERLRPYLTDQARPVRSPLSSAR